MNELTNEQYQELKTFALGAPLILPMIQRRKQYALDKILAEFNAGGLIESFYATRIAELAAYANLEREILQKAQEFKSLEENNV